jgi:phosphopantothenoylcysteine decarboxylase/phosphopantothenate--cysteine ligase
VNTAKKSDIRHVVLGVTGGIAAYKSAELVRRLRDAGMDVRVVMTRGAEAFVTPLTFQAVSTHPVHTRLLDETAEAGMGHIELARWADLVLIAPASADFIARLAHGLAGDLLATMCLATAAPVWVAPAMNQQMWLNPATRDNCSTLESRGIRLLGPASGDQACGEVGVGRMLEPFELVNFVMGEPADAASETPPQGILSGMHIVVTAGPTYEDIDPVRFIGNRSSGRMGFAVAEAAFKAGARVSLVAGPTGLVSGRGIERYDVRGARQMHHAVMNLIGDADVFIGVAAVADYTPADPSSQKIKKGAPVLGLELEATPDIVAEVASLDPAPFTVGFAAETENLREHALGKLSRKGLDMIAANQVGSSETGFESEYNALLLITADEEYDLGRGSKVDLASQLIEAIGKKLRSNGVIEAQEETSDKSGKEHQG